MMQFMQFYDPLNAITGPVSAQGIFCLWHMHDVCRVSPHNRSTVYMRVLQPPSVDVQIRDKFSLCFKKYFIYHEISHVNIF